MNKKYLVAYILSENKNPGEDRYVVFIDDEDNLSKAREFYKELLKVNEVYSANLCEILANTDY